MKPVLLVSNGHGEDLSGAQLGTRLQSRGIAVQALPLVGHGQAYRRAGIAVLGRTRQGSTGGLGYTSLRGRLTDLLEGQPLYLLGRLALLVRQRRQFRLVVGVGDLLAVLAAWLSRRPSGIYLVAYSSHYEGRLRLPWPCGWLLRRRSIQAIWSRDALTASDLSGQLGRPVRFLGNPFVDGLRVPPQGGAPDPQRVLLLPGSRLPEAGRNLVRMLAVLSALPPALASPERVCWRAALVPDQRGEALRALPLPAGWRWLGAAQLGCGELVLELGWSSFEAWLVQADLVLAAAGTASEQAVALAKPVVQIVGEGPQFTAGFAEAQRRLLGPGVFCASGRGGSVEQLGGSAYLITGLLQDLRDPERGPSLGRQLRGVAAERLGGPGASARLTEAIMALLHEDPADGPAPR